jgi:hypothetical protein
MKTNKHTTALAAALTARYGSTPSLLDRKAAQAYAAAFMASNPDEAVKKKFSFGVRCHFATVESIVAWLKPMTPDQRSAVLESDDVMGWFYSDDSDDDTADVDGEFMSTAGSYEFDDIEAIESDIEHMSRGGLVMIDLSL